MSGAQEAHTILVIDDTPENLRMVSALLKDVYKVRVATSGAQGLEIALSAPPDLILLDIMMPEMDGYETCRRLKSRTETAAIPIIFLTAKSEEEDETRGFELGAADYITKPFKMSVVKARVQTQLALRDTKAVLERQNLTLLQERVLVEDIITCMRSSKAFDDRYLRYLLSSVDRTNGDVLLSAFTPDGRQWVLVGDFTGHGLPAAVGAPLIAHVFYDMAGQGRQVEAALLEINRVMCRQLPVSIFMAACLIEISSDRGGVRLWNAGMPQCLLLNGGKVQRRFDSKHTFLGILPEMDIGGACEAFDAGMGDRLYIFSDGVMEVADPQGELFGLERTAAFLATLADGDEEPGGILKHLERHRRSKDFSDDITLVEIRMNKPGKETPT